MKISLTHADIVTAVENHVANLLHTTDATTIDIVVVSEDGAPLELEAVLNNVTLNTTPTIPTQTAPKKRRSSAEVAAERAAKQGRKALGACSAPAPTPATTPAFDPASMLTTDNEAVEAHVEPVEPPQQAEPTPVAPEPAQEPVAQAEAPVNPFLANVQAQPQTQPTTAPAQSSGAFLFPQTK